MAVSIFGCSSFRTGLKQIQSFRPRQFASARFLPFEESCDYVRRLQFKKQFDFTVWSRSGQRPEFIHSNPNKFYRNSGWISFPHYLGYERPKAKPKPGPVLPRSEHAIAVYDRPNAERQAFVEFVTERRPDLQLRTLPVGFNATHLFRCSARECDELESSEDLWLPLQIKWSKSSTRKDGFHSSSYTADPGTGVIFLCEGPSFFAGLREELKTCFHVTKLRPWEEIFSILDEWWRTGEAKSEFDCIGQLRSHGNRNRWWRERLVELSRSYFSPWKLSISLPVLQASRGTSFILGGCHRVKVRVAGKYVEGRDSLQTTIHPEIPFPPGATDFDFFLVVIPEEFLPWSVVDEENRNSRMFPFFFFPRDYLAKAGYLPDTHSTGKNNVYLFPPFKAEKRKKTIQRKAEQAPYWVDSVEKFGDLLRRFGQQGGAGDGGIGSISGTTVSFADGRDGRLVRGRGL